MWLSTVIMLTSCGNSNTTLEVHYLKEGKLLSETIKVDVINDRGEIRTPWIDSLTFARFDSLNYENGNPDRPHLFSTPLKLDFSKKIETYSPEYYAVYTAHFVGKAIDYYNSLFGGRIDFDAEAEYRNLKVLFADIPLFTTPKEFYFEQGSNVSPSLFYHEVGHRAFWYLEDGLGIKFNGLTLVHMGLLEYFTVSLNDSPVVGEDALPSLLTRNASFVYTYPPADSLNLGTLMRLFAESYPEQMKNPAGAIRRTYDVQMEYYADYMHIIDNHRGGMILASTLWRIRQSLGQAVMDKLVAETILNLNAYMDDGAETATWRHVYRGLVQKDKEMNGGHSYGVIHDEFQKTGYPVETEPKGQDA
jgi:hypothetical protein